MAETKDCDRCEGRKYIMATVEGKYVGVKCPKCKGSGKMKK